MQCIEWFLTISYWLTLSTFKYSLACNLLNLQQNNKEILTFFVCENWFKLCSPPCWKLVVQSLCQKKPCWKIRVLKYCKIWKNWDSFDNSHDVTIHGSSIKSFTEQIEWTYKMILSIMTIGCCGHTCVVLLKSCVFFEEEICLVCWQLLHDMHAMVFNPSVNFLYFLSNWVNLLDISTSCEKLRAFERNPSLWNNCLLPWRPIV